MGSTSCKIVKISSHNKQVCIGTISTVIIACDLNFRKVGRSISINPSRNPIPARVVSVENKTETIKTVRLDVKGTRFSFKSGQWSDVYMFKDNNPQNTIKENMIIAGFSMTSSPSQLESDGTVDFAVKQTRHPVTQYIHSSITPGSILHIDGGHGEFYYTKER